MHLICSYVLSNAHAQVGIAATQLGKKLGLRVLGTAGSEEGLELVKKNGADMGSTSTIKKPE